MRDRFPVTVFQVAGMSIHRGDGARRATVLVVDDQPAVLTLVRRMLEAGGYLVYEAADGLEAIAALVDHAPIDIVVSDLRMPNLDGLSLSAVLSSRTPRIPLVLMSGYS